MHQRVAHARRSDGFIHATQQADSFSRFFFATALNKNFKTKFEFGLASL